jgi:nucleosome binding factor SPN SPT16 subunit
MTIYYQVCPSYALFKGKPQLVSVSLHSTPEYHQSIIITASKPLSTSRFFHNVTQAQTYISYLFSRYPNSKLKKPVLDANQLSFF